MANRRGMVTGAKLEKIADALREVTGSVSTYKIDDIPDAIRSLRQGGSDSVVSGLYQVILVDDVEIIPINLN